LRVQNSVSGTILGMERRQRLDDLYAEYHRNAGRRGFVYGGEERAELFRRRVGGPGRRVLDIGCRDGALTRAYAEGNEVVGLDVDRGALAVAEQDLGIETLWHDADEPLPFPDASFDAVVLGEVLEHLVDPIAAVAEAQRVLRTGGTLVGSIPNAYRLKNRFRFLAGRPVEENRMHLHVFSPEELRGLLRDFDELELQFISSRFLRAHPRLLGNMIVFAGVRRGGPAAPAAGLQRADPDRSAAA
jgi:SAM-dependent methyltransferase